MTSTPDQQTRHCQQCGKLLYGRSDKSFCNDSCRNIFNKQKRKQDKIAPHPNAKVIFNIIKKNYEILKSCNQENLMSNDEFIYFEEKNMDPEFDPRFYTSIHYHQNELWYFCFDQGWCRGEHHYYISQLPSMAKI